MLSEEVRKLVEHFESNMENITSLHRLITVVEKKYRDFWSGIWKECEASGHDMELRLHEDGRKKRHFCLYCGKKLSETHSFWEDSFPQKIYRLDYLKNWLMTNPEDWPEDKRELLAKIKDGIGEYLNMAEPLQDKMKEYAEDQVETRAELAKIYALCDSVLHNSTQPPKRN